MSVKVLAQKFSSLTTMIALIVLMIIITCINPNFMTANNLLNLLLQVTANGFIAFGMTFVILTSGIDLSVGAILALSSAVSAGRNAIATCRTLCLNYWSLSRGD